MQNQEKKMRKTLIIALGLVSLGPFVQLAFAEAPTDCVQNDQRCRDQQVSSKICQMRFNYCAAYNRKLGLNWSGWPLPGRTAPGGNGKATGVSTGLMPGAAVATSPAVSSSTNGGAVTNSGTISTNNGGAVTNSGVILGRRGSAGGGNGLLFGPGTAKLKAQ
jgi:hypothetical protein